MRPGHPLEPVRLLLQMRPHGTVHTVGTLFAGSIISPIGTLKDIAIYRTYLQVILNHIPENILPCPETNWLALNRPAIIHIAAGMGILIRPPESFILCCGNIRDPSRLLTKR